MRSEDRYSRKLFVGCDCGAHAIELTRFRGEDEVYLNCWFMGRVGVPLLERLKAIWKIFVHGGGYLFEEIILDRKAVQELKSYLEEVLASNRDVGKGGLAGG